MVLQTWMADCSAHVWQDPPFLAAWVGSMWGSIAGPITAMPAAPKILLMHVGRLNGSCAATDRLPACFGIQMRRSAAGPWMRSRAPPWVLAGSGHSARAALTGSKFMANQRPSGVGPGLKP